ncbi:hypothetical protein ABPG72_006996 [Tetrahymena utriculariae]
MNSNKSSPEHPLTKRNSRVASTQELHMPIKDWISHLANLEDQDQILEYFETYKPQSNTFDMNELKNNPNLRIKRYKNCIYYGIILEGLREGRGILCYYNGRIFEGEWKNDKKHGKATEIYQNGGRYFGNFANGKKNGKGQFKWVNGEIYDGEWKDGTKHGSGLWKGIKGDSYIGEWKEGKTDGFGVHTWINGDRYEGEFKQCLKHGLGTERFANGDVYIGNYEYGKPEGYGEYYWSVGNFYKGYFVNGLRHGRGIWKAVKDGGDCYEGEYRNDKKCGYGEYKWGTGNIYKGNFENDLRHGYGEMYWKDGTVYKGYWMNGLQVGEIKEDLNENNSSRLVDEQMDNQQMQHQREGDDYLNIPPEKQKSSATLTENQSYKSPIQKSQNTTQLTLPKINGSDYGSHYSGNKSKRLISLSPEKQSQKILPKLECQTCANKRICSASHHNMIPQRNASVSYKRNNNGNLSNRRKDLSIDQISTNYQSPRENSNSRSNSSSRKAIWRPSGIAQHFNPVGFDLNAKNHIQNKYNRL